jgi:hypothetical protein
LVADARVLLLRVGDVFAAEAVFFTAGLAAGAFFFAAGDFADGTVILLGFVLRMVMDGGRDSGVSAEKPVCDTR